MPLLSKPRAFRLRAVLARLPALVLILLALAMAPQPAMAQGAFSDFFGSIFSPRHAPPPVRPIHRPKPRPHPINPSAETNRPSESRPAAAPENRPAPTFFVAVIGDSLAGMLAQGLAEAFADDPRVSILNKTREDSGLVRDDFYDWRLAAKTVLEGPQHIDMVVIQIGINDNQKLRLGDVALDPLSKPFNEIYAKRVEEIAAAFHDKNVPLVWAGLPIMRSENLSNAALLFNDLDRQYAGALGAHFVDLWEPFTDINSAYKASGPDVNGAIVRLRAADGVHFNKAGARKAAHFVVPEIRRVMEAALQPATPPPEAAPSAALPAAPGPSPAGPSPAGPQGAPGAALEPAPPPKPLAGKVQPLTEPEVSPGGGLAGLSAPPPPPPEAAAAQPGRADDFRWPPEK